MHSRFAHGVSESGSCIGGAWIASANCATVYGEIGRPGASRSQENEGTRRQVAKAMERSGSRGVGAVVEVDVSKIWWKRRRWRNRVETTGPW